MSDYKHGQMDVSEHEKTFEGFIRVGTILATIVIAVLVFLALVNS